MIYVLVKPDEVISSLLTVDMPDEGISSLLTVDMLDEGISSGASIIYF
jgi:hypothetical protein